MEGTVTISLKNYEILKEDRDIKNHYVTEASNQISLLMKIEEYFDEEGMKTNLSNEVRKTLNNWY